MFSVIVITLLGGALAAALRADAGRRPTLPDDLWGDFEATEESAWQREDELHALIGQTMASSGGRASSAAPAEASADQVWAPGTVGAMAVGDTGYVNARAAMLDLNGALWLAAAAVVHDNPRPGHVAVRLADDGYHLQRHDGAVGLWNGVGGPRSNARVRVSRRFD